MIKEVKKKKKFVHIKQEDFREVKYFGEKSVENTRMPFKVRSRVERSKV